MVNSGFEKDINKQDIYEHVTSPEFVYLLEADSTILAMASYNRRLLSGIPSLIVEGIVIAPEVQGKGLFGKITNEAFESDFVIGLRTQNPLMYKALENYCSSVYPGKTEIPEAIKVIREELARYLVCDMDTKGVIKGYYGGLFYGREPTHKTGTEFFKENLGMRLNKGDALVVLGIK
ncbi:hypothetical protein BMS3Abin17_00932 [archaeon BMS3Abin17]|nr:hypothetical protein BMS3Abin17_00932 [archaeon BMS3Abin17]HDZ60497.1 hypothetical protein [Candidatus Pacearchaeota archaeon]